MPFIDYITVDVPTTNSESGALIYTTQYRCMIFFVPIGSRMEDDSPAWLYVEDWYIDTDSDNVDFYLHSSQGTVDAQINNVIDTGNSRANQNQPCICESNKRIIAKVGDNSDRIGGTLHIFRLPEAP